LHRDYQEIPELDKYEEEGLDNEEYDNMDEEAKREAEKRLNERDRELLALRRRLPAALQIGEESDTELDDLQRDFLRRRRERDQMLEYRIDDDEEEKGEDEERYLDASEARGKLHLWIKEPRTIRWIRRNFKKFLLSFEENGDRVYIHKINDMCSNNRQSLEVSYTHITTSYETLAVWIAFEPAVILPYLNTIAFEVANHSFPGYENIVSELYVRIRDLPVKDSLRELRKTNLNTLIKIEGVITRRSQVFSQLKKVFYECQRCGEPKGPFYYNGQQDIKLGACAVCQANGPFTVDRENTVYRNYQKITVQESPGSVQAGRVPRQKEVVLLGDNIDIARPGDEVEVTGIYTSKFEYSLNIKHGFPVFSSVIEANFIRRLHEIESEELLDEDKIKIKNLAKRSDVGKLIINSIAPSIYGHHHIKTAMALAMFGGEAKDVGGKHRIRGDINVLVLGDPGTAKSQFLKYVEKTFARSVYTTGKGASAVGLTASVHRDASTGEWTLEGGALVLADKGICLIDEFDKMDDHDRTSIHEAMEQQSISISKAGIIANLQARCSVIAAANPVKGRYDSQLSFADNVDLTDPILSRFDILCVVKDEVQLQQDMELATFVINSHIRHHPDDKISNEEKQMIMLEDLSERERSETIDQSLLRKYISHARTFIKPKLTSINKEKITKFYTDLRKESTTAGGINIAVRHIESVIRMSEANARMHLREYVNDDDVDLAISVMLQSFIQSQKFSVSRMIQKKFMHYIKFREENSVLLKQLLDKLVREKVMIL
jgi:DNA replication licensing factor MCM2